MQKPVQVAFQGLPYDAAIEDACLDEVQKLERYSGRITSCRVVLAQPHHRHRSGNQWSVRLVLSLPGKTIAVTRPAADDPRADRLLPALRSAFDVARRRIEDRVRIRRGAVKAHATARAGR